MAGCTWGEWNVGTPSGFDALHASQLYEICTRQHTSRVKALPN